MKNKKNYQEIQMGYNKIPSQINQMSLSVGPYALFHYLASLPEEIDPSKESVARKFNSTRQTIARWYKELEQKGIIKCYVKGGLNRVTKYEFTNPKGWIK